MSVAYCTISGEWTLPGGGDPGRHPVIGVRYAGGAGIVTDDTTGALVFSGVSAPVGGTLMLPVDGVLPDPGVDGLLWEATLRAAMAGGTEFTFTFRVPPAATALTWGEVVTDLLVESTGDPTSFAALAAAAQAAAAAAEDARAAAEAARDEAVDISGIATSDGVVSALLADDDSDTATALAETIFTALGSVAAADALAPVYVATIDTAGHTDAAPGARTGLASTQHSVTAADGVTSNQGYTVERIVTGVSGTKGAYTLTVTDTTTLATLDGAGTSAWDAAVVSSDGTACTVTVLDVSGGTVTLAQPLPNTVTAGTLASRIDEPTGQHLTKHGYRALAQHIARATGLTGARGGIIDGQWDTLPAAARPKWTRNAALLAYGSVASGGDVVVSNIFDSGGGNVYDTGGLYIRASSTEAGVVCGTHAAGHGAVATIQLGGRGAVVEFYTSALRTTVVTAGRIRVVATTSDGAVVYDQTVGGTLARHVVPVVAGVKALSLEVTNTDGGIYYMVLHQMTVRVAGLSGRLASRKALLIGDSWTQFGDKVLGIYLAEALGCEVVTFGKGGTKTDWGISNLDTALAANPGCDTVITHFYTNDLNSETETWWRSHIQILVSMIQARGLRPVVVLPGSVNAGGQINAAAHAEQPELVEWSAATAEFTEDTSYLNAVAKRPGQSVLNTTTGKPLWASGSAATDPWKDATGTTAHTPA